MEIAKAEFTTGDDIAKFKTEILDKYERIAIQKKELLDKYDLLCKEISQRKNQLDEKNKVLERKNNKIDGYLAQELIKLQKVEELIKKISNLEAELVQQQGKYHKLIDTLDKTIANHEKTILTLEENLLNHDSRTPIQLDDHSPMLNQDNLSITNTNQASRKETVSETKETIKAFDRVDAIRIGTSCVGVTLCILAGVAAAGLLGAAICVFALPLLGAGLLVAATGYGIWKYQKNSQNEPRESPKDSLVVKSVIDTQPPSPELLSNEAPSLT